MTRSDSSGWRSRPSDARPASEAELNRIAASPMSSVGNHAAGDVQVGCQRIQTVVAHLSQGASLVLQWPCQSGMPKKRCPALTQKLPEPKGKKQVPGKSECICRIANDGACRISSRRDACRPACGMVDFEWRAHRSTKARTSIGWANEKRRFLVSGNASPSRCSSSIRLHDGGRWRRNRRIPSSRSGPMRCWRRLCISCCRLEPNTAH